MLRVLTGISAFRFQKNRVRIAFKLYEPGGWEFGPLRARHTSTKSRRVRGFALVPIGSGFTPDSGPFKAIRSERPPNDDVCGN